MKANTKSKTKTAVALFLEKIGGDDELVSQNTEGASNHSTDFYALITEDQQQKENISLQYIPTNLCQSWKFADRPENEMGDISELAKSIKEHGQQEPALLRPNPGKSGYFEVIFGNRRLRACQEAGIDILAVVKNLTDQEASVCQKEENENRENLSDFAKATSYKKLIENKIFLDEIELSKHLRIRKQQLNDIMAFTRIPNVLSQKLKNIHLISRNTAIKIASYSKNPEKLSVLLNNTDKIDALKINAANIDKLFEKQPSKENMCLAIFSSSGEDIAEIKYNNANKVEIKFNKALNLAIAEIVKDLKSTLEKYG